MTDDFKVELSINMPLYHNIPMQTNNKVVHTVDLGSVKALWYTRVFRKSLLKNFAITL